MDMNWYKLFKKSYRCDTAAVVIVQNNKVLILKRGMTAPWMPGYWNLPGGLIELNETPEQAAIRETQEEAGISVSGLQMINTTNIEGCPVTFFGSKNAMGNINTDNESSEHAWVEESELNQYQFVPGVKEAIMAYLKMP